MSDDLLLTRIHLTLAARAETLRVNLLAYNGEGRPCIDERLSRIPGESKTDFAGDRATGTIGAGTERFW